MNPISQRYRTLGELMTELRARLGFVTQGSASKNNDAIIKSFLQEAHEYVYGELDPPSLRTKCAIALEAGSYLYDFHDDALDLLIDPTQVQSVWLWITETDRAELHQGITEVHRAQDTQRNRPERYDNLNGQIELWPVPDAPYQLVVEHIAVMGRFSQMADRPSVPDRLVFLYALANAKAHYGRSDAQAAATTFQNMLNKAKAKQKENRRYFAGSAQAGTPGVVWTASGYRLRA